MGKSVKLCVSDEVLSRMLSIVLKGAGYEISEDAQPEPETLMITDDKNFVSQVENKVLYLLRAREDSFGGENLLLRPFYTDELIKTVDALTGDTETESRTARSKDRTEPRLDKRNKRVMLGGKAVSLTEKEFALFSLLYENKGSVVTDAEIDEKVWKGETVAGSNITAVYINYLRNKIDSVIGRKYILRIRGQGYKITLS